MMIELQKFDVSSLYHPYLNRVSLCISKDPSRKYEIIHDLLQLYSPISSKTIFSYDPDLLEKCALSEESITLHSTISREWVRDFMSYQESVSERIQSFLLFDEFLTLDLYQEARYISNLFNFNRTYQITIIVIQQDVDPFIIPCFRSNVDYYFLYNDFEDDELLHMIHKIRCEEDLPWVEWMKHYQRLLIRADLPSDKIEDTLFYF